MRVFIRLFFRLVRLILTPFMLLAEKLSTPKALVRSAAEQTTVDAACSQLALYQFSACPFCIKVRKQVARLGLNIEKRDAQHNQQHRSELEQSGGKVKVPCLRIETATGEVQWLYESADIIAYLQQRFA
ncbi:MAG: glutathione S-transferase N-terminal domain-containing protein [Gammaproteobacteria bacterium]|nr:glutathione S-transferase N-terminal domain-containing protein [Gammaproteobacteria bacterium]MBU1556957.1 glutathione S-transferase N-terminal domain-containing protein [Gammaproteobacteria bacterium]MBU2069721.1 glutathione S-transferase N-terminal domain-containing protein [Gammaproteobacteria bacterium]MBU2184586.1 glutathione S-transferase N-terminal domain-containing protein [Gammaproteobacteria bacterium]MBU2205268.1 glutathione S-transferase N-terminal domain-containing protein [Gamm